MEDLKQGYNIDDIFFHRYFIRNAENTFVNNLKKFMLWKQGTFPNPKNKMRYVQEFLTQELDNYFNKGQFHIPQIGFSLTTRCTLRCENCIAFADMFQIPEIAKNFKHIDTSFEEYKQELSCVCNSVDGIKRLFLHGGEPLLNKDLPQIVDFSASQDKIELVELITNGTVIPSDDLLDAIEKHKHKVYLAINDYSKNSELESKLHFKEIIAKLDERGIKHPLYAELQWFKQVPLKNMYYSESKLKQVLANCWCIHSLQILNGILAICPRASMGQIWGITPTPDCDIINIREAGTKDIRQEIIDFYKKDMYLACGYCVPQTEVIPPAGQANSTFKR